LADIIIFNEVRIMAEILARCGYRCDLCAARSKDPDVRQKMVDGWKRYFNLQMYTVDNVKCDGCYGEIRADKTCPVRPCVIEKGIENCAHCDDYICDKLRQLIGSREGYLKRFPDVSDENYNLCMRQFDSLGHLQKIRRELGKE
jgi:hypothetical protein